jgi:hypothetical protein
MKLFNLSLSVISFVLLAGQNTAYSQEAKLQDFRGTTQKLALVGAFTEFVEPDVKEKTLQHARRALNRYTRSYGSASIASFKLANNPHDLFFRPAEAGLEEEQKKYLDQLVKENNIDIVALASIREVGEEFEMDIQLFDKRIEELSGIEKARFPYNGSRKALEILAYKVMNYLDREGYVQDSPQNFLTPPKAIEELAQANLLRESGEETFSINPADLGEGILADGTSIGGEKTPFWEKWWFWTLIGGTVAVGGGLSYYFLVVNQPPTNATVGFDLP